MLDFAANNTVRYRITYRSNSLTHTMLFRTGDENPETVGAEGFLPSVLASLEAYLPTDFSILDAETSAYGSDIFVPSLFAPDLSALTFTATPERAKGANYVTFSYKDAIGVLGDFQIFGWTIEPTSVPGDNFRYEPGDNADVDLAVDAAIASAALVGITTISGRPILLRRYVNYGVSAYWQRKLR